LTSLTVLDLNGNQQIAVPSEWVNGSNELHISGCYFTCDMLARSST